MKKILLNCAAVMLIGLVGCQDVAQNTQPQEQEDSKTEASALGPIRLQALDVGTDKKVDLSVEKATMFSPSDMIFVAVHTLGESDDSVIRIVVTFQDGTRYADLEQQIKAYGPQITSFALKRGSPWRLGKYVVDASLNDETSLRQYFEVNVEADAIRERRREMLRRDGALTGAER